MSDKPLTEWDLQNLHVSDDRVEVLREAYTHLATDAHHTAIAPTRAGERRQSDAEHASIMRELQRHRDCLCRECEGRTYVPNPDARYSRDNDTGNYETNDPEEVECPRCDGVGYEKPARPAIPAFVAAPLDDDLPF